jgi:hypothetical protein
MTTQDGAAQLGSSIDPRLGCSTISFRAWTLPEALAEISGLGFTEIDLGALPGVCDHVPTPLPAELVDELAEQILASGLSVRLINADVAQMDDPDLDAAEMQRRLRTLVDLAGAVATSGHRTAHRTVGRQCDGSSHPPLGRRSSSTGSLAGSPMVTFVTPSRRTSICPSDTAALTLPAASRRLTMRAMPASSPSSWKPATSPTTSGPRLPPKPHN